MYGLAMSQLVGMASGEYRHHLVTIWPLQNLNPLLPPPPLPCPYLYVKRPSKREIMVLGWPMGMRTANIWPLPMVSAPPGSQAAAGPT